MVKIMPQIIQDSLIGKASSIKGMSFLKSCLVKSTDLSVVYGEKKHSWKANNERLMDA